MEGRATNRTAKVGGWRSETCCLGSAVLLVLCILLDQIFLLACFESLECFSGGSVTLLSEPLCLSAVLQQPNTMSITKKFNYKLVKSGNIILTATSDLKGYIVGQAIQLRTDIENKSGRDTGAVVASLLQVSIQKGDFLACTGAPSP